MKWNGRPIGNWIGALVVSAAVSLAAAAASAPRLAMPAPQAPPPAASSQTALADRWTVAWNKKDLEAVLALYADDAVFMPSTGTRFTGRAALRELFAKAFASSSGSLQTTTRTSDQSGGLAYDSGDYVETTVVAGRPGKAGGNYLLVARQVAANDWRIVQHMWTDEPPPR